MSTPRSYIALYPFEHYDVMCRRWMRARYVATIDDVVVRYAAVRIIGAPELRKVRDPGGITAGHLARGPEG